MKKLFAFILMATMALAADQRSKEEIENENLKLRLLLKKMEMNQKSEVVPEENNVKDETPPVKKNSQKSKWYTGTSFVQDLDQREDTDESRMIYRLDQYFIHSDMPDFTYKVGISESKHFPVGGEEENLYVQITDLVLAGGYNLISYKDFFFDIGVGFFFPIQKNIKADSPEFVKQKIEVPDTGVALETGLGYSLERWSIRLDISVMLSDITTTTTTPDNVTETNTGRRSYIGVGVAYWW